MRWKFAAALVLGAAVGYVGAVIHVLAQVSLAALRSKETEAKIVALAEAVKAEKKARKGSV